MEDIEERRFWEALLTHIDSIRSDGIEAFVKSDLTATNVGSFVNSNETTTVVQGDSAALTEYIASKNEVDVSGGVYYAVENDYITATNNAIIILPDYPSPIDVIDIVQGDNGTTRVRSENKLIIDVLEIVITIEYSSYQFVYEHRGDTWRVR